MGILDDAIREHLDLKRRLGAEDDELARLEDEAFGPPSRPGDPDFPERRPAAEPVSRDAAAQPRPPTEAEASRAGDGAPSEAGSAAGRAETAVGARPPSRRPRSRSPPEAEAPGTAEQEPSPRTDTSVSTITRATSSISSSSWRPSSRAAGRSSRRPPRRRQPRRRRAEPPLAEPPAAERRRRAAVGGGQRGAERPISPRSTGAERPPSRAADRVAGHGRAPLRGRDRGHR